jgi:putative inorganic carbon (HCO3(-)) transporter
MITHSGMRLKTPGLTWVLLVSSLWVASAVGLFIALFEGVAYLLVPGTLAVIATALIATRYERLPFYLLMAALPLEAIITIEGLSTSLLIVPGGLAIFAWLQQLALRRTTLVAERRATALAVLVGILATMSAMNAGGITAVLTEARRYWLVIILFFLAQNLLREKRHFVEFGWVMTISLGLVGALVLFDQVQAYLQSGAPLEASQLHDNILDIGAKAGEVAMQLTKGIPFAFYLGLTDTESRRTHRYLLVLCAILMILGAFSTLSINGFLGLGITIALMVLAIKNPTQRMRLAFLGMAIIGIALISPLGGRLNEQRLALAEKDPIYWGTNRGLTWYGGLQAIRQEPWLGNGPGSDGVTAAAWPYIPFDMLKRMVTNGTTTFIPHNIFLSVGAELGVPGLLAFLALLASVMLPMRHEIRRRWSGSKDTRTVYMGQAILIGLVALLTQGMALSVHLDKYLWLLLGAGVAFTCMSRCSESG